MIIKWRNNTAKVNHFKIKFEDKIITADRFKSWNVVVTATKMYFFGDEDFVLSLSLYNAVFTDNFIYFHSREDRNVYKLRHPLKAEIFLFYSPHYILTNVIVHNPINKIEDPIFILCFDSTYIIKKKKTYYLYLLNVDGVLKHVVKECFFDEFLKVREQSNVNHEKELDKIEFINKINSSLEDKLDDFKFEDNVNVTVHGTNVIAYVKNTVSFIDFLNFTERDIGLINKTEPKNIVLEDNVKIFRPIRLDIAPTKLMCLLQINNLLFINSELVCKIDPRLWLSAHKNRNYNQNYYKPFWSKSDRFTSKLMAHMDRENILRFISKSIETTNGHSILEFYNGTVENINRILMIELIKAKSIDEFIKAQENYLNYENLTVVDKLRHIKHTTKHFYNTKNYHELINIKYTRIFFYDKSLAEGLKYKHIHNLAYQIIFLEENKNFIKEASLKWEKYAKFFYQSFRDTRMNEVRLLFAEEPKTFNLENDGETINEKAYILRLSCNVGRSLAFYDSVLRKNILDDTQLTFPMWKNLGLTNIEIKEKHWKDWPSFNYKCSDFLSIHKLPEITIGFVEDKVKSFDRQNCNSEHTLAGLLYAFGLRKLFNNINYEIIKLLITETRPILSMILLINFGLGQKSNQDQDLYEHFLRDYNLDIHPLIRMGLFVATSYNYMNSKNINIVTILTIEADRTGPIVSETYNKNNVLYYDQYYSLSMGFMLAYVSRSANLEFFKFFRLRNKLVELLVNGLVLYNTGTTKYNRLLHRSDNDSPEELFYSEFFINTDSSITRIRSIRNIISEGKTPSLGEIYKLAGSIFAIGVRHIVTQTTCSDNEYNELFDLCLYLEEKSIENDIYNILVDYCLVSLSLIKNSSCDLELLKIIRRQIKKTEKFVLDKDRIDYVFAVNGIVKESQTTISYGRIERYKICLGLLTLGLSRYKLSNNINTVIDLVVTFYVNFPICTKDQDYFNLFRFNIFNSVIKSDAPLVRPTKLKNGTKSKFYNVSNYFKTKFKSLSEVDKKFIVDVLSDYYENYHDGDYLIDIDYLKDLVIRCS